MKKWLSKISPRIASKKRILNQAALMTLARVSGMALAGLGQIWAARCLGPRNLGLSAMVQSGVAQASMAMGLISSTVLIREYKGAKSQAARSRLLQLSNGFRWVLGLSLSLLGALLLVFHWVPDPYASIGWFFIPLFLFSALQPLWIFQALEKQHFQSALAVLEPALGALLYFIFFKPGASAAADLTVNAVVALALTLVFARAIQKLASLKGGFFKFDRWGEVRGLIYRSRWFFLSSLAIYVYTTLEQPLLGYLYSVEALGKYRTAVNSTNAAQAFFTIIPAILYPRFIEWRKRGPKLLWARQVKLAVLFAGGGALAALAGFFIIPFLYPYVFGPAFSEAALPCALLVLSKIVVVVGGIFYWGLVTDDRHDRALSLAMAATAVFSLSADLFLIPRWGMTAAASVDLASESGLLVFFIAASVRKNRGPGSLPISGGKKR